MGEIRIFPDEQIEFVTSRPSLMELLKDRLQEEGNDPRKKV